MEGWRGPSADGRKVCDVHVFLRVGGGTRSVCCLVERGICDLAIVFSPRRGGGGVGWGRKQSVPQVRGLLDGRSVVGRWWGGGIFVFLFINLFFCLYFFALLVCTTVDSFFLSIFFILFFLIFFCGVLFFSEGERKKERKRAKSVWVGERKEKNKKKTWSFFSLKSSKGVGWNLLSKRGGGGWVRGGGRK